ncbi:MAG: L,D-transpeptidase [Deltaproteobacteria bacterium]|nr:L,D-transpeptidase [Deltaproteobacteria bacterium]
MTARKTYVRKTPSRTASRLGVVVRGTRLRVAGKVWTAGCQGPWYRLAASGYICSEQARLTTRPPGGVAQPVVPRGQRLPYQYVLAGQDGAGEYANQEDAEADMPIDDLAPGFGRTVVKRVRIDDVRLWRTTRKTYLLTQDVFRIRGSRLHGERVTAKTALPIAFVTARRANLWTHACSSGHRRHCRSGRGAVCRGRIRARLRILARWKRYDRCSVVAVLCAPPDKWSQRTTGRSGTVRRRSAERLGWRRTWLRCTNGGILRSRMVRIASRSAKPAAVPDHGFWVDIDLSEQTLVAYHGSVPVYATLVSAGRNHRTPTGLYRVWAKLAATDMTSPPDSEHRYSMWDVPWTMYFRKGLALHGAYWHDQFGNPHSHGCVNLSPADARWLFDWAPPKLPAGWWAILSSHGTTSLWVRIRRSHRSSILSVLRPIRFHWPSIQALRTWTRLDQLSR